MRRIFPDVARADLALPAEIVSGIEPVDISPPQMAKFSRQRNAFTRALSPAE